MRTKQIFVFLGLVVKDKKILMVQRTEEECPEAHMKWEIPGGKMNTNETSEEAVKRELLEETGVEVSIKRLSPYIKTVYWNYSWGIQQTVLICYECEFIKQHKISHDHHVHTIEWIPLDEVEKLDTLPGAIEFIDLLKS